MPPSQAKLLIYLIFGIGANLVIAFYAWNHPRTRGRKMFVLGVVASCLWMLGSVIGRWSADFTGQYLAEMVRYAGITTLPVWVFAFTRQYCGKPVGARLVRWLLVVPALSFGILATTLWNRWFFSTMRIGAPGTADFDGLSGEFGPYFWWVHLPYSYGLALLSLLLVVNEIGRVPRPFRGQIVYLCVALSIPMAIDAAGLCGILQGQHTAFSIPIFPVLMGLSMFRHDFLGVNPVAYERIVENIRDGVIILDRHDAIMDINRAAAQCAAAPSSALIGKPMGQVFAGWKELLIRCRSRTELTAEVAQIGGDETRYFLLHISHLRGIDGQVEARTLTLRDITDSKNYQASLETLAFCDPLTRLSNRRKLGEAVESLLGRSARENREFAVVYFDLNRFKAVNDALGHEIGDELLKCVGARAAALLRAPDFVARLGGDEFVILLHDIKPHEIAPIVARFTSHVEQPCRIGEHLLLPQLSLGTAFYPQDGADLKTLLRHADGAMYQAKARGGGYEEAPGETPAPVLRLVGS